jgi:pyruvate kinase
MKKTKIVATIGPATESEEMLTKMLKAGMNVMRLNFSHGDFAEHQNRVNNLRSVMKKTGMRAAILQDLSGPKIRLGEFYQERVELKSGDKIVITTEKIVGDEKRVSINYKEFPKEVKPGDKVMVDDGKKQFEVLSIKGNEVTCKIVVGGNTKGRRGVNLPDTDISMSCLTEKDLKDVEFGIKNKVDFIALSFVRKPSDIVELREILKKKKCNAGIIAKIETPQAVKNIDEIISLVDGLMIAR